MRLVVGDSVLAVTPKAVPGAQRVQQTPESSQGEVIGNSEG
jgi:hypothetical protein